MSLAVVEADETIRAAEELAVQVLSFFGRGVGFRVLRLSLGPGLAGEHERGRTIGRRSRSCSKGSQGLDFSLSGLFESPIMPKPNTKVV